MRGLVTPCCDGTAYFVDDGSCTPGLEPVQVGCLENGPDVGLGAVSVEGQVMPSLGDVDVHVEGVGQAPAGRLQSKAVISKVVVPIADKHIEHGATEELFQVLVDAANWRLDPK